MVGSVAKKQSPDQSAYFGSGCREGWQSRKPGPCICQELVEVLAAVKVADVGQALPLHKHQGQHGMDGRWLREK